jgi:UDPglucose 6-dehydrogenase
VSCGNQASSSKPHARAAKAHPKIMNARTSNKPAVVPRRICIVGLWHQATVLSACFAKMGHFVATVGNDEKAVRELGRGKSPVVEPKLNTLLRRAIESGHLTFTTNYEQALQQAEFVFIAIDTPVNDLDEPQLESVREAARQVGRFWNSGAVLCVTSQVPVGTCESLAALVTQHNSGERCDVAYIPEFLRLGDAVNTFFRADRFVIGALAPEVAERVAELYLPLGRPVLRIGLRSAEMAKHSCNCFLATSISFINELSDLCDCVGADSLEVARVMKLDRRIGPHAFLSPGLGFAGGTLGRELRAIEELARQNQCGAHLPAAVLSINRTRAGAVKQQLLRHYESLRGIRIGILGVTYKAGTSTLRRSVALDLIADFANEGAEVRAYDPLANWKELPPQANFSAASGPYDLAEGSDALVLVTEWSGILDLDFDRMRSLMRRPVFVDTRNLFDPQKITRAGFLYSGIGRGHVPAKSPALESEEKLAMERQAG